jgi:hypothetical protein
VWERNVHKKAASVIAIAGSFIWLHLHAPPLDLWSLTAACRRLEALLVALVALSMQDPASELLRIPLLRLYEKWFSEGISLL